MDSTLSPHDDTDNDIREYTLEDLWEYENGVWDHLDEIEQQEVEAEVRAPKGSKKAPELPIFYTLDQLMALDVHVEYLLEPMLTAGGTLLISAPKKTMKSYLGLQMGMAMATGKRFADLPTKKSRVLYIDFELGPAEAKKRLGKMRKHFGNTDNFMLRGWQEGKPISLDPAGDGHVHMKKLLQAAKPDVVFLDTLRTSHSKEENSNTEMNLVFDSLRELKLKYGFAAVLLHHMSKPSGDPSKEVQLSGRGAGVIEDRPDTLVHMTRNPEKAGAPNVVHMAFTFRNHEKIEDISLKFDTGLGLFVRVPAPKVTPPTPGKRSTAVKEDLNVGDDVLMDAEDVDSEEAPAI